MRCRLVLSCLVAALAPAILAAVPAAAQVPTWRPAANPDPLRAASLPFEPGEAGATPPGAWRMTLQTSYFNLWSRSWHTSAIHRETGRVGQPLAPEELRVLERRYPGDSLYFIDLEGWRSELSVSRGFASGVTLTARLPWVELGRPHWDRVAERWHSAFGLPSGDRELFPRGGSLVYLDARPGTVERRDLDGAGLGDLAVSLSFPVAGRKSSTHRAVLAVEAPTGRRDGVLGSGGWDLGVRWFSSWRWRAVDLKAGAGWTRLAREGSLLGLRRADPWHLTAGVDWRLSPRLVAFLQAFLERSLLTGASGGQAAEPAVYRRLGLAAGLGGGAWLAFDVGQDSQHDGLAPDYSFHLALGTNPSI